MSAPRLLELDLLKVFVAAADHGGFSRAAKTLHRTQSAVSMQMKRLEDCVGTPLFARQGRSVRLTGEGEALMDYARRLLAMSDEALCHVSKRESAGTVRVGSLDDYATRVLPRMLIQFARANPNVRIHLRTGLSAEMLERLDVDYDLVLGMQPVGTGRGILLARDSPVWATATGSRAHKEDPLPLALYPEGCLFRRWATRALEDGGRAWQCTYVSPSYGALEAAVRSCLAVSVFKRSTLPGDFRRLGPAQGFPDLPEIEIALHRSKVPSRATNELADYLVERLKKKVTRSAALVPRSRAGRY
jgi:DNA-binding transcriptional LysR family regulator